MPVVGVLFCAGCSTAELQTPKRYEQGLVVILPGIEGKSILNVSLAHGLADGGLPCAIEIYDWTAANVATWFVNLAFESRNREIASRIARRIVAYQGRYPGRPVCLIGHSGGGGVAAFVLEALPQDRPINCAILLAAALSPEYDLCKAIRRTKYGIWNCYSPWDVGWLALGTGVFGTIDREHSAAAGSVGFREPPNLGSDGKQMYRAKLHQLRYSESMASSGNSGGHVGWASHEFAGKWLAPVIYSQFDYMPPASVRTADATPPAAAATEASIPAVAPVGDAQPDSIFH